MRRIGSLFVLCFMFVVMLFAEWKRHRPKLSFFAGPKMLFEPVAKPVTRFLRRPAEGFRMVHWNHQYIGV